jgi:hypothetical protein
MVDSQRPRSRDRDNHHDTQDDTEPQAHKRLKSTDPSGKNKPDRARRLASVPLLQWAGDVPTNKRNRHTIATLLSTNKSAIPRVQDTVDSKPFRIGGPICFPFVVEGLGCTCSTSGRPKFAHVDTSDSAWKASHLAELKSTLAHVEVAKILVPTDHGNAFLHII